MNDEPPGTLVAPVKNRLLICVLVLAGCATMESASQESLLQKAGFQSRTPTTEKQKTAYRKLSAYQLQRITLKGRTVYAYKDEKAETIR